MEYGMEPLSNQDLVLLSAYLDGQLTEAERQQIEKRLAEDTNLQAELASLQDVVHLVNSLPRLKAPRNFTLDPAIYGKQRGTPARSTQITRLKMWQLSSIAGVAALFVLVIGGVLIGNPFTNEMGEDSPSSANNVAQVTYTKTETDEIAGDVGNTRQDETVIAILPTDTIEGRITESQQDLGLTITAEVARAFATDTPIGNLDNEASSAANADDASNDTSLFDDVPPSVPSAGGGTGGAGEGENYAPSPESVYPPAVSGTDMSDTTEIGDYDENEDDTQNTQDVAEESAGEVSPNVASANSPAEGDRDGDDAVADSMPADGTQAEKYWIPFSDGLLITGTVGIILTLVSLLLRFLMR